jgi:hypothetical protein
MATEQSTYRATNDAYTGMLAISLLAMIAGSALLFLDYQQYPDQNPPAIKKSAPAAIKAEPPSEKAPEQPKEAEKKADEKKE